MLTSILTYASNRVVNSTQPLNLRRFKKMKKLLLSYAKNPTIKKVRQIEAYARKHPFSICALTEAEQNVLDDVLLLAENI